ncbi:MAG: SAM-dependent methyltransferase [Planctomycetota bacterium]|nr:MAG: SAM-dependent methyltransferase [Planctomycetota bacterium]
MFTLKEVVPWGRSFDEYRRMFALTDVDLGKRILGCADGPASFNAEATLKGAFVISCDPLYQFSDTDIRERIDQTFQTVMDQTTRNAAEFHWDEEIPNVEALGQHRMTAMRKFLDDYNFGKSTGRYIESQLPELPFDDNSFDLAICSHFLFLYSQQLSAEFHLASLRELVRVSREVRVFPLLELGGQPSRHLDFVQNQLCVSGFHVEIVNVPYEFQRGGNQMMRIQHRVNL